MKRLSETIGRIGCAASVFKEPFPDLHTLQIHTLSRGSSFKAS